MTQHQCNRRDNGRTRGLVARKQQFVEERDGLIIVEEEIAVLSRAATACLR